MPTTERDELKLRLDEVARLLRAAPPAAKPTVSPRALEQERKLKALLQDVERLLEKQKLTRRV